MEPADLNSTFAADDDRNLEALLRRTPAPLADNGFSSRVMAALPPPRRKRSIVSARAVLCSLGAAAGLALAWSNGASLGTLAAAKDQLHDAFTSARVGGDSTLLLVIAATVVSLLAAFPPRRPKLF